MFKLSLSRITSDWLHRHREKLIDAGLLWLILNLPKILLNWPRPPWLAQLAVLALFAVLLPPKASSIANAWLRYRRLLPNYVLVSTAGAFGLTYWFNLPNGAWWLAPLWLGLTAAVRLPLAIYLASTREQIQRRRLDVLAGDVTLLVFFTWAAPRWAQQAGPSWLAVAALAGLWIWAHFARFYHNPVQPVTYRRDCWFTAIFAIFWSFLWLPWGSGTTLLPGAIAAAWLAVGLCFFRLAVRRWARLDDGSNEVLRWLGLFGLAAFLFHPFARAGVHGSGDADYYATFLADALEQFRHGVFPVFVGQSEYQFNGSVIPIRIAPGFQYAGGLLDLLTGRTLNPMAVQNILVTLAALGAAFAGYACLRRLRLPAVVAWFLAVLYLTCPGVMGLAFNADLYMSWLTIPWIPVAFHLCLRSFSSGGAKLYALLAFVLGLTWWFHAPIALWLTLTIALLQLARMFSARPSLRVSLLECLTGACVFLATACCPVVSAVLYPADPAVGSGGGFIVPARLVLQELQETFPGAWLPLSDLGRLLVDYQLGYGLLAVGLLSAPAAWRSRRLELRALVVIAIALLLLLLPLPWLNLTLWKLMPNTIRIVTNVWVMQRLYAVLAAILVALPAWTWVTTPKLTSAPSPRLMVWLLVACLWSFTEALKFVHGSWMTVTPLSSSPSRLAPENIVLTRYSYGMFSSKPSYFTHGVTDPTLENRLLAADLRTELTGNYAEAARLAGSGRTSVYPWRVVEQHVETRERVMLEPGEKYLATLDLPVGLALHGTLVLEGKALQGVYGLPEYGEPRSFGLGGAHNRFLPLHTSMTEPEKLRVLFESSVPVDLTALANQMRLQLYTYSPDSLPVQILSWLPYHARVRSSAPAWLETPRMYQRGYAAKVNGQRAEVRRSAEGLASIPVPQGDCEVTLEYVAPTGLRIAFWVSLAAIGAGLLAAFFGGWRTLMERPAAGATPGAASP